MELSVDLKRALCELFEIHLDERGVQRIVTPLEYPGSNDRVVLRVRPQADHWVVDENGEAALFARLNGGDTQSEAISRWADQCEPHLNVQYTEDETLCARVREPRLLAPTIFRVACAAQQLYALATSQLEREASDFKEQVAQVIKTVCEELKVSFKSQANLPISGDLQADYLIGDEAQPLIVIAAASVQRLLEAQMIHLEYRCLKKAGFVLAVVKSQQAVGTKQFHRANYYTAKTVQYHPSDFSNLLRQQLMH